MTTEEIEQFKKTIQDTIVPNTIHLNHQQIFNIIKNIPNIEEDFKNMLLEQIIIMKESYSKKSL